VEGFTALVVDSGGIGLVLLLANLVMVGRSIVRERDNPNRGLLLFSLFCIFMWLFVISLSDNTLFYLAIIPQGILVQLSKGTGWEGTEGYKATIEAERVG
jgi:O-antigen ligase